jgi:L-amino acid N-acyltransferase YncA
MNAIFRFAQENDGAGVQAIYAPFCESTPVSFEMTAPTVDEMAERISRVSARFPWLICEHEGAVAGYVYASPHRERAAYQWSVDVTAYMGPGYRGAGIGRGLYTSLIKIVVLQGYYKAYAGITLPNPGSVGLHEAMGFEPVGVYRGVGYKLGSWHDVGWWQMSLQPEIVDPPAPRGILEIKESDAVQDALRTGQALVRVERLGL